MTDRKITIELTERQLTDIRVAVFARMTTIHESLRDAPDSHDLKATYERLQTMMSADGILYLAMKESTRHRDIV